MNEPKPLEQMTIEELESAENLAWKACEAHKLAGEPLTTQWLRFRTELNDRRTKARLRSEVWIELLAEIKAGWKGNERLPDPANIVAAVQPPLANLHEYRFTFGQKYHAERHPAGGHPDGWFTIIAPSEDEARQVMVKICGDQWGHCYPAASFEPTFFKKGELRRINWGEV